MTQEQEYDELLTRQGAGWRKTLGMDDGRERAELTKMVVSQMDICAECARPSTDGATYLNDAAREMLRNAVSLLRGEPA